MSGLRFAIELFVLLVLVVVLMAGQSHQKRISELERKMALVGVNLCRDLYHNANCPEPVAP